MKNLLFVFLGGGLGSLGRYWLGKYFQGVFNVNFPVNTLIINILASLILGLVMGFYLSKSLPDAYRLLLVVGFCGGFSTFSTFGYETLQLLQQGQFFQSFLYVLSSVLCCVLATFVGLWLVTHQ
jgi:CrcB protein